MQYLSVILFIFAMSSFCGEFPVPDQNNNNQRSFEYLGEQIIPKTKQIFSLKSQLRALKQQQLFDYEMLKKEAKKQGVNGEIEFDECERTGLCSGDEAWFVKTNCYKTKKFHHLDFCAIHFIRELYSLSKKNNPQTSSK